MAISHIVLVLKTSTGLCIVKESVKVKSTFANIVYNVLVVEEF